MECADKCLACAAEKVGEINAQLLYQPNLSFDIIQQKV